MIAPVMLISWHTRRTITRHVYPSIKEVDEITGTTLLVESIDTSYIYDVGNDLLSELCVHGHDRVSRPHLQPLRWLCACAEAQMQTQKTSYACCPRSLCFWCSCSGGGAVYSDSHWDELGMFWMGALQQSVAESIKKQ